MNASTVFVKSFFWLLFFSDKLRHQTKISIIVAKQLLLQQKEYGLHYDKNNSNILEYNVNGSSYLGMGTFWIMTSIPSCKKLIF